MSNKTIVIIEGTLPRHERAFACFSEGQALDMWAWLAKNGVIATAITIEEFHAPPQVDR